MKRGSKPKPELSPEIAAIERLTENGASSNAAIRKRIALIAAERKLDPSETMAMMKGRWLRMFHLRQFAKKYHLSVDWLITGDLKGLLETVRGCPSRPEPRPVLSGDELVAKMASLDQDGRQFIIDFMNLLLAKRST